jgi:hypothetical protein
VNAIAWLFGIIGFLFFNYFIGPKINEFIDNTVLAMF